MDVQTWNKSSGNYELNIYPFIDCKKWELISIVSRMWSPGVSKYIVVLVWNDLDIRLAVYLQSKLSAAGLTINQCALNWNWKNIKLSPPTYASLV